MCGVEDLRQWYPVVRHVSDSRGDFTVCPHFISIQALGRPALCCCCCCAAALLPLCHDLHRRFLVMVGAGIIS